MWKMWLFSSATMYMPLCVPRKGRCLHDSFNLSGKQSLWKSCPPACGKAVLLCVLLLGKEKWGGAWCKRVCHIRTDSCLSILCWEIHYLFNLSYPVFNCLTNFPVSPCAFQWLGERGVSPVPALSPVPRGFQHQCKSFCKGISLCWPSGVLQ